MKVYSKLIIAFVTFLCVRTSSSQSSLGTPNLYPEFGLVGDPSDNISGEHHQAIMRPGFPGNNKKETQFDTQRGNRPGVLSNVQSNNQEESQFVAQGGILLNSQNNSQGSDIQMNGQAEFFITQEEKQEAGNGGGQLNGQSGLLNTENGNLGNNQGSTQGSQGNIQSGNIGNNQASNQESLLENAGNKQEGNLGNSEVNLPEGFENYEDIFEVIDSYDFKSLDKNK